jgi:hypothetical protein
VPDPFVAQDISNEDLLQAQSPESPDIPFEEIVESREIIEEKIFAIKCRMIDYTVRQWDF